MKKVLIKRNSRNKVARDIVVKPFRRPRVVEGWAILHPSQYVVTSTCRSEVRYEYRPQSLELDYFFVTKWYAPKSPRKNKNTLAAFKECHRPNCEFVRIKVMIPAPAAKDAGGM